MTMIKGKAYVEGARRLVREEPSIYSQAIEVLKPHDETLLESGLEYNEFYTSGYHIFNDSIYSPLNGYAWLKVNVDGRDGYVAHKHRALNDVMFFDYHLEDGLNKTLDLESAEPSGQEVKPAVEGGAGLLRNFYIQAPIVTAYELDRRYPHFSGDSAVIEALISVEGNPVKWFEVTRGRRLSVVGWYGVGLANGLQRLLCLFTLAGLRGRLFAGRTYTTYWYKAAYADPTQEGIGGFGNVPTSNKPMPHFSGGAYELDPNTVNVLYKLFLEDRNVYEYSIDPSNPDPS